MGSRWYPSARMMFHYPFESVATQAMLHLAEEGGPFNGEGVLQFVRRHMVDLLHRTLPSVCIESECTLCRSEDWGHVDKGTGEIIMRAVTHSGDPQSRIMFVGEAPGGGEYCTYIPFTGTNEVLQSRCIECDHYEECFRTIL